MKSLSRLSLTLPLLAACASAPQLSPWRADPLLSTLPPSCEAGAVAPAVGAAPVIPGGIAVVRSAGRDVILVAARGCVMTVDAGSGAAELLPTHGDSIAPTMVDATSEGLAFSSSLSGSVRAINATGAVVFNTSGLHHPLGVRLIPGGVVFVAEFTEGRILRLGPNMDSRPRLLAEGLDHPVGLVVLDKSRAYVSESGSGRITRFGLEKFEKATVASGLKDPEGIARMNDGRLAVVEVGMRRLVAVDTTTGKIEVLADNLPIGLAGPDGADAAYTVSDVAAAPDGTLFVSSDVDRTVLKITPRPPPAK